jgi:hypothetical protein
MDLSASHRVVSLDEHHVGDFIAYSGMTLTCYEDDKEICGVWLPLGDEPTLRDWSNVLDHLQDAQLWSDGVAAQLPIQWLHEPRAVPGFDG